VKKHLPEKYLNLATNKHEFFTFIGNNLYRREADGKEFKVMDLRMRYRFISTYKTVPQDQVWDFNPVNGFKVRVS